MARGDGKLVNAEGAVDADQLIATLAALVAQYSRRPGPGSRRLDVGGRTRFKTYQVAVNSQAGTPVVAGRPERVALFLAMDQLAGAVVVSPDPAMVPSTGFGLDHSGVPLALLYSSSAGACTLPWYGCSTGLNGNVNALEFWIEGG